MSSSWCMWCQSHPSNWKFHPLPPTEHWTIAKIKGHKELIDHNNLKEPRHVLGIVNNPVWDFVEVKNYIFPELHAEIGIVNNVLDKFYSFIDDKVEAITPEEATFRNSYVAADVAQSLAIQRITDWKEDSAPQLEFHRMSRIQVARELRKKTLHADEITNLRGQLEELDETIKVLVQQKKTLEADLSEKRKNAAMAKSDLKRVRENKLKVNMPVFADIENILLEFGISAAAYHGGKLNGVDCRELIKLAKPIFEKFKTVLLSVSHPGRCSDDSIVCACDLYRDICVTLDSLCSKLRMKHGETQEEDYMAAEKYLENLHYLWMQANLTVTPKVHGLLNHAVYQMRHFKGIGDTLEDDVERIHQISAKIEARVSRMKNKAQQAVVHSKMEAIQNCNLVKDRIEAFQLLSKRVFKKRNIELCAQERGKKMKKERDDSRTETLHLLESKPHAKLLTSHEISKAELLAKSSTT